MLSDDLLLKVRKPGQYIGGEWNSCRKDFDKCNIKFALCFPDLYEVGMSNLGLRIIYDVLNRIGDVSCERFFSPEKDMEGVLRDNKQKLFSLESGRALKEFDLLGFSLSYELSYTNILAILDLGDIPLAASMRNCGFPLVIGAGPCVLNPEPIHEFFDLFIFGEGEEVIAEVIDAYRKAKEKFKSGSLKKQDLLLALSAISGVYVPSLYDVEYGLRGEVEKFGPKMKGLPPTVHKRIVANLDTADFPLKWLLPYVGIVHDRATVEVMRGCPNRCRFCQARSQYFPWRKRSAQTVLRLADELYKNTGYEEVSLAGLSVSDYPHLEEVLSSLINTFKEKAVSLSLPSIKPRAMLSRLSALIASIRKTGLTFAPEAATERLRRILDKDFDEREFFEVVLNAYAQGYRHIKLYFMTGLPFEEPRDLDSIVDFAARVSQLRRKVKNSPAQVNVSINTLVPKPHTPFQWLKMDGPEEIKLKQDYLRKKVRNRSLNFSFHNPKMSFLEGILSRGDRRLSRVISAAFSKGARFDAWDNSFNLGLWLAAFSECGIDPDDYLRQRQTDELLAWDFLDTGISKDLFLKEYNKLVAIK